MRISTPCNFAFQLGAIVKEALHFLVFVAHAENLVRRVNRRFFVVLAVTQNRIVDKGGTLRTSPYLKVEARILVRRARSGKKRMSFSLRKSRR